MDYQKQIYWDDVEVGQEIPSLVKRPTHVQMLMWGGAVDDYNPMHADADLARRAGYKEPIVFGPLIFAFLEQMLTDWIGIDGWINEITIRHNNPAYPEDEITCKGKITNKYEKEGNHIVELDIQADYTTMGPASTTGSAVITLPCKIQAYPHPKAEPFPDTTWFSYGDRLKSK